jgi:hypothetical protein
MELVEIEIEMTNELLAKVRDLALRFFGDDSPTSLSRVVEVALIMRYFWARSIEKGQDETGEPVSRWEFSGTSGTIINSDSIRDWLFRRQ